MIVTGRGEKRAMRYAIYFTPDPSSELHRLGSAWFGRDAASNMTAPQTDERLAALTADARRYGFHGTLKPPFRLKESASFADLELAVRRLANEHESLSAGALELRMLDGFLALTPAQDSAALRNLAADCVQKLDDFRSPPDEAELRKRRTAGLSEAQEALLLRWGYPYVLEEFRFHLTLTTRLSAEDTKWLFPLAQSYFAPVLRQALLIESLSMMVEPDPGADFAMLERFPLVSKARKAA